MINIIMYYVVIKVIWIIFKNFVKQLSDKCKEENLLTTPPAPNAYIKCLEEYISGAFK